MGLTFAVGFYGRLTFCRFMSIQPDTEPEDSQAQVGRATTSAPAGRVGG